MYKNYSCTSLPDQNGVHTMNYEIVVSWDAGMRDVQFADADSTVLAGLAFRGLKITAGAPTATVGKWLPGAIVQNINDADVYRNDGTTAVPSWVLI